MTVPGTSLPPAHPGLSPWTAWGWGEGAQTSEGEWDRWGARDRGIKQSLASWQVEPEVQARRWGRGQEEVTSVTGPIVMP